MMNRLFVYGAVLLALILLLSAGQSLSAQNLAQRESLTGVTFYLPFAPEARTPGKDGVTVSRTGGLYRDAYQNAGWNTVERDYCGSVQDSYCYGPYGDYHRPTSSHPAVRGAIDFILPYGTQVLAAADGTVTSETNNCQVVIEHADGTKAYYLHLSKAEVKAGNPVNRGDPIGKSGDQCGAEGAHLHFAVWSGSQEIMVSFADASVQAHGGFVRPSKSSGTIEFPYIANGSLPNDPAPDELADIDQSFPDVSPENEWFPHIELLSYIGAVGGFSDGEYKPAELATRGQTAKIIILSIDEEQEYDDGHCPFQDVCPDNVFYSYIRRLKELDITYDGNDDYNPNDDMNRGGLAKFIVLARVEAGLDDEPPEYTTCEEPFLDVPCDDESFYPYIRRLKEIFEGKGIQLGYTTGNFYGDPNIPDQAFITRVGIAKLVVHGLDMEDDLPTFYDVLLDNPFSQYVEGLVNSGITDGCTSDYPPHRKFCADFEITRAEAAKFVARGMGVTPEYDDCEEPFPDVPCFNDDETEYQFYPYIRYLSELNIVSGHSDGEYKPYNSITRGEIAKIIVRALEEMGVVCDYDEDPGFSDVDPSHTHYISIQCLKELGITSGYSNGEYKPDEPIIRTQAAKFMYLAFIRIIPDVPQEQSDNQNDNPETAPTYVAEKDPTQEAEKERVVVGKDDLDHIKLDLGDAQPEEEYLLRVSDPGLNADLKIKVMAPDGQVVKEETLTGSEGDKLISFKTLSASATTPMSTNDELEQEPAPLDNRILTPEDQATSEKTIESGEGGQDIPSKSQDGSPLPATSPINGNSEPMTSLVPTDVINGDFEQGNSGWEEFSTNGFAQIYHADDLQVEPYNGNWAAWLGGAHDEIGGIRQQVSIPSQTPTLRFRYWIISEEDQCGYDVSGVVINSNAVDTFELCADQNTDGWAEKTVDLSAYAGQTVELQLRTETDASVLSHLFLDDVVLNSDNSAADGYYIKIENTNIYAKEGAQAYIAVAKSSVPDDPICPGDFDNDNDVDIVDVQAVAYRWNTESGDALYDPVYDLDSDGDIDISDVQPVAYRWDTTCEAVVLRSLVETEAVPEAVSLAIQPSNQMVEVGQTFTIDVGASGLENIGGFEFTLAYDPTRVEFTEASLDDFLSSTERNFSAIGPNDENGNVTFGAFSLGATPDGPSGDGQLATLTFRVLAEGTSTLEFTAAQVTDVPGTPQDIGNLTGGEVTTGTTPEGLSLSIQPSNQTVEVGQTFTIDVAASDLENLGGFEFTLAYDPTKVEFTEASLDDFLDSTGRNFSATGPNDENGSVTFGAFSLGATPDGPSGDGQLATLTFRVLAEGTSTLDFTAAEVTDVPGTPQDISNLTGGEVTTGTTPEGLSLTIQPSNQTVEVGQTFTIDVAASDLENLGGFEFTLAYDPTKVEFTEASLDDFLNSTGRPFSATGPNDENGNVTFGAFSLGATPDGPSGDGQLATLTFRALAQGSSGLDFTAAQITDVPGTAQDIANLTDGEVTIQGDVTEFSLYLPLIIRSGSSSTTSTSTPTHTPTEVVNPSTSTSTPTHTPTNTPTHTPTNTPTRTSTPTNTPVPTPEYTYTVNPTGYVCGDSNIIKAQFAPDDVNGDIEVRVKKCDDSNFILNGDAYIVVDNSPNYTYEVSPTGYVCGTTGPSPNIVEMRLAPDNSNHNIEVRIRKCAGGPFSQGGTIYLDVDGSEVWGPVNYSAGDTTIEFDIDPFAVGIVGTHSYIARIYSDDQPTIPKHTGEIEASEEYGPYQWGPIPYSAGVNTVTFDIDPVAIGFSGTHLYQVQVYPQGQDYPIMAGTITAREEYNR